MSQVRIKNISQGTLVFTSIRMDGGLPLTLNAGEEKDVPPSVVTQPSLQIIMGTKVIVVTGKEISVAPKPVEQAPATPPVIVMEDPTIVPKPADSEDIATAKTLEMPVPINTTKVRKGRR